MTVFAKDTVYGLETTIKDLQNHIDTNLTWSGTNNIYGLVYPILRDGNLNLESYKGTGINNKEYGEIFINDKVTSTIGFLTTSDRNTGEDLDVDIECICTVRLDLAYNTDLREDEQAMLHFRKVMNSFYAINNVEYIKTGLNNVFSGYYVGNLLNRDMHPWLVFSMGFNIKYPDDICR